MAPEEAWRFWQEGRDRRQFELGDFNQEGESHRERMKMMKGITFVPILAAIVASMTPCASADSPNPELLSELFSLTDVDKPPRVTKKVDPVYPFEAKVKNVEGVVTLRFIVTRKGEVRTPSVIKSLPEGVFDNNALRAIRRWRFDPATKDGKAVDVLIIAPLKFELLGGPASGYDTYLAVEQGVSSMRKGDFKQAVEEFTEAIGHFPRYSGTSVTYNHRGLAYKMLGNYEKAISDFGKALKLDPEQTVSYLNRGDIHAMLERYQEALDDYTAAIALEPESTEAHANRGYANLKLGRPREGADDCTEAIRLGLDTTSVYYTRGNAYRKLSRYREAVQDYDHVINRKPEFVQAYNYRGYAYNKLGKADKTCDDFATACKLGDCRGADSLKKQGGCK